ncbi:MAG: four-carbon acid sugar kinase family protein [Pirellulales bacterium]|nr:four-carbon acid sugar kinase family protein [Pirellulales bacterium]
METKPSPEVNAVRRVPLPPLVLAYYGDDFTGSADVMEALANAGLPAVLFLEPPTPEMLARHPHARAVGVAGVSRSMTPAQMDAALPAAFDALGRLGAPLVHYKVCSTFDSSPAVGSIGRALELARERFSTIATPIVVGAPILGRYCAFGNVFARSGLESPVYRLDRHPTMSCHPTTPIHESDVRLLLARETTMRIGLADVSHVSGGATAARAEFDRASRDGAEAVVFDSVEPSHLPVVGQVVWDLAGEAAMAAVVPPSGAQAPLPLFVVGSSGVEYALTAHWIETGLLSPQPAPTSAQAVKQIVCVSGSCSPVTARQIEFALAHGFVDYPVDPSQLLAENSRDVVRDVVADATALLSAGVSVVLHTSRGPDDARIKRFAERRASGTDGPSAAEIIGSHLGQILRQIVKQTSLQRVAVTGGDTSGYVARQLGIESLEYLSPVAPGSPICRAHGRSDDTLATGLEIAFKGGQVGYADYLVRVRDGRVCAPLVEPRGSASPVDSPTPSSASAARR